MKASETVKSLLDSKVRRYLDEPQLHTSSTKKQQAVMLVTLDDEEEEEESFARVMSPKDSPPTFDAARQEAPL